MMERAVILYAANDAARNGFLIDRYRAVLARFGVEAALLLTDGLGPEEVSREVCRMGASLAVDRGRDIAMARALEEAGIMVTNPSPVRAVNDKLLTCRMLSPLVPMLDTFTAEQEPALPYPFVIKPVGGHGGSGVALIGDGGEYLDYIEKYGIQDKIIQPVATGRGRDMRVYVIGGRPVAAMLRKANSDIRSNFSLGGSAEFIPLASLEDDELRIVSAVCAALPLDYAGVDIMRHNGHAILNEVEDPVGARMLYTMTDIDPAELHVEHVMGKIK